MSLDKIFDLTAGVYYNFYNKCVYATLALLNVCRWTAGAVEYECSPSRLSDGEAQLRPGFEPSSRNHQLVSTSRHVVSSTYVVPHVARSFRLFWGWPHSDSFGGGLCRSMPFDAVRTAVLALRCDSTNEIVRVSKFMLRNAKRVHMRIGPHNVVPVVMVA